MVVLGTGIQYCILTEATMLRRPDYGVDRCVQRLLKPYRHAVYRLHSAMPVLLPNVQRQVEDRSAVAITIDDGPSGKGVGDILRLLAQYGVQTTWFLSGAAVERHPASAAAIMAAGHAIGTHGYQHRSALFMTSKSFVEDVTRSRDVIADATGIMPTLYRPPYGRILPRHISLLRSLGCRVVLWSRLPGDWNRSTPEAILHDRLASARGGDIVVLHDRPEETGRLMQHLTVLIRSLELRGLRATLLDQRKA